MWLFAGPISPQALQLRLHRRKIERASQDEFAVLRSSKPIGNALVVRSTANSS
jgi:hypothetical protein